MVSFEFEFDKPDKKYTAGETVVCTVKIVVSSKFKAQYLAIRINGVAHTNWFKSRTVDSNGDTRSLRDRYTGDEEFFKSYQYMFGGQNSIERDVAPGAYTYNFQFNLPENIPSNFEHRYGHIRYSIKAFYNIAQNLDKEETAYFCVTSKIDLNEYPYTSRNPVKFVQDHIFGRCFCETGPMHLINVLPKNGYVIGETIPITVEVDNDSNVRIRLVRVQLKEILKFITHNPGPDAKSEDTTVYEYIFEEAVKPFVKKTFQTTFDLNPNYDFKLLDGCNIIKCEYHIKSEAVSQGGYTNPDISTRVVIGTIPLIEETTNESDESPLTPSAPFIFNPTAPTNGVIVEQPLPSYHDVASSGPSGAVGWNLGLKSPSGAPLASTEKIHLDDDLPPPSFEESQKHFIAVPEPNQPTSSTPM